MIWIVLAVVFAALAVAAPKIVRNSWFEEGTSRARWARFTASSVLGFMTFMCLASTSFTIVPIDHTGHLHRKYGGKPTNGRYIARQGENGPQARILYPGLTIEPFLTVLYDVEHLPMLEVEQGFAALLKANDGRSLETGQRFAEPWPEEQFDRIHQDAAYALGYTDEDGNYTPDGKARVQEGQQLSLLPPAKYHINQYLWTLEKMIPALDIKKGTVAVIKANVHAAVPFGNLKRDKPMDVTPVLEVGLDGEKLENPLVPVGAIGIWDEALTPGSFFIHPDAYKHEIVDTRVQTWKYNGGYETAEIILTIDNDTGTLTGERRESTVAVPENAVSPAIRVPMEGWNVYQELRVLVQVTPENAPFVVASVGGLEEVEERILTPAIRSEVRNALTSRWYDFDDEIVDPLSGEVTLVKHRRRPQVLDTIENRPLLEQSSEENVKPEGEKAGVTVKELRFGDSAIPPELLVTRRREQLAQQLTLAYEQEEIAQLQRVKTENAKATAEQQSELVRAEIEVQSSKRLAEARKFEGQGEKDRLTLAAEGQREQAGVLGEDRVLVINLFKQFLEFAQTAEGSALLSTAIENADRFVPVTDIDIAGGEEGGGLTKSLTSAASVFGSFVNSDESNEKAESATADSSTKS